MRLLLIVVFTLLNACTGIPKAIQPVNNFELNRYLGSWYEIARLDHRFERGLSDIRAEYSLREDGGVTVINSGYDAERAGRHSAEGRAYFIDQPTVGRLKVSFWGPFYGAYNIFALDTVGYEWVMICGPDLDYLWILSRTPRLDEATLQALIQQAKTLGFATEQLIFDQHP